MCPTKVMSNSFKRGSWMLRSALERAGGYSKRYATLEKEEDDERHRHGDDEGGAQDRDAQPVLAPHHGYPDGQGPKRLLLQDEHGEGQLVPHGLEADDRDGGHHGHRHRRHDAPEDAVLGRPVDARGLYEL